MERTFFTPERAMTRYFYVNGRTDDEFYTDGLCKLNIEQLLHMELKQNGYRRVVFFDKNNKLYTYDDESYQLLDKKENTDHSGSASAGAKSLVRPAGGLRNGKLGQGRGTECPAGKKTAEESAAGPAGENPVSDSNGEWIPGTKSGIRIRNIVSRKLHMGMADDLFVSRTIDAYMNDKFTKTAIVINDLEAIKTKEFEDFLYSIRTKYERMLGTDNQNIIVFIEPDIRTNNPFEDGKKENVREEKESGEIKKANQITIGAPCSMEVKNMLMYMRIHHGLDFPMKDLNRIAVSLHQAMELSKKGTKQTYIRLLDQEKTAGKLDEGSCYEAMGIKKPLSAEEQLNAFIGMEAVKKALLEYKVGERSMVPAGGPRIKPDSGRQKDSSMMIHIMLTGNPGTGKTTVAKLIGQLFYEMGYLSTGHVVETDRSGLVAKYIGHTAEKTRNKVMEAMGGVLFIDEAYALKKGEDDEADPDFGQEAIDTLVKCMDEFKGKFILVAAGYKDKMEKFAAANDGLGSRLTVQLHIEDYTPEEMHEIVMYHAKKDGFVLSEELEKAMPAFCENWVSQADKDWGNAREARNLVDKMVLNWKKEYGEDGQPGTGVLEKRHIPSEMQAFFKPLFEYRAEMAAVFNNMVGLSGVKGQIERLRRRMKFRDLKEPGHYIFARNPGTGKTTVARHMGRIMKSFGLLKRDYVEEYSAERLKAEYMGKKINGRLDLIVEKAVGGVLFIDEAYQLADDPVGKRILDGLLTCCVDHSGDLCIILAGYEEEMDELLKHNPGLKDRFSNRIVFDNYTGEELFQILIQTLKEEGTRFDEEYAQNARQVLIQHIPVISKDRSFSNVRYLKNIFIPECKDAKNDRLMEIYGDEEVPQAENKLTGDDFSEELMNYLLPQEEGEAEMEQEPKNAVCPQFQLSADALCPPYETFDYEEQVRDDFRMQKRGTVFLRVVTKNGESQGSGAFISNQGYILTCEHVIHDSREIHVMIFNDSPEADRIWERGEVVWSDKEMDAAIVKVSEKEGLALPLEDAKYSEYSSRSGHPIYMFSFPFGEGLSDDVNKLNPSFARGYVKSLQVKGGREQIDVDISAQQGSSGGPVFSRESGAVIGILCGSHAHCGEVVVEQINYVLPVKYIWEAVIRNL